MPSPRPDASAISGEPSEVMHPAEDVLFGSIVEGEGTAAFHARGGIALRRDGVQIGVAGVFGDASNERQDLACATAGSDALPPPMGATQGMQPRSTTLVVTADAS